jgi:hypothetical protein
VRIGRVLGSLLLASTTACSYAFVRGPPAPTVGLPGTERPSPASPADCTTSNAAPVIDTILAVPLIAVGGLAIAGAASAGPHCGPPQCVDSMQFGTTGEWTAVAAGALALGTLAVASAATGYGRTADCRRLKEAPLGPPQQSQRYLLDVSGISAARAHPEGSSTASLH